VNYKEIAFEDFIEQQVTQLHGYRKRNAREHYDKKHALDGELVLEFIKTTQKATWDKYLAQFDERAADKLLDRLDAEVASRGLLDVLRKGIDDQGAKFYLAYFQSDSAFNADTEAKYEANTLSVIRQVKYSEQNDNSIDTVLFLNGLPIFTVELKNPLTGQTVEDAIKQYKSDRDPREKLLSFKRTLVHFAVDPDLVYMTTKLDKMRTYFLPFNRGNDGGAGNTVNPDGHKTAYLWEDVWTRASILEIVGKFMTLQREEVTDEKGRKVIKEKLLFPRYHQREAVQKIVSDARIRGSGKNYLIQHSAGSGKSNTIAWTAHRLSELYDESCEKKVFDTVIIITDRRVLDKQLRETVEQFAQVRGVVKKIEGSSQDLKTALEDGEKIITTTIQKFGVIMDSVGELPGKKFAIIVDEAHSSQSGEGSKALRKSLHASDLDDAARADDDSRISDGEDEINKIALAEQKARLGNLSALSIFAFTATPKQKTLELFGDKQPDGSFKTFSLYTMRQAIEEGFILDVLQNYTTYRSYFEIAKAWQQSEDKEYEKKKAQRLLFGYVDKHEHAIALKTKTIAEHFHQHIEHLIDGKAKAMIVTKSRLHAVRYKQAFDAYLRDSGLSYGAIVAFSGEVFDGTSEFTEAGMNGFSEKETVEQFKKNENKFLIVASKYQTGFDQPLLSVMYVDKKLNGVGAVQTLSRLNRTTPDKNETFVLDFVNETDDIVDSFQPYYTTTVLSEATDQNLLYDLQRDILQFKAFSTEEVEGFVTEYYLGSTHDKLNKALDPVVARVEEHVSEELKQFKSKINDYLKRYAFVSQILLFEDSFFEKLYVFLKFLKKKLPVTKEELPIEILEQVNIDSLKVVKKATANISLANEIGTLEPMGAGDTTGEEITELEILSRIIKDVNEKYGTEFTPEDKVIANILSKKLYDNESLDGSIENNARDIAKVKFDELFEREMVNMVNDHFTFYQKVSGDKDVHEYMKDRMFDTIYRKKKE
jgi:type I restriction enzyme, R subunit